MKTSTRSGLAFLGFAVIAAFLLATEHRAHLFGALPLLFLLACPFLHRFSHGGHAGSGASDGPDPGAGHSHQAKQEGSV